MTPEELESIRALRTWLWRTLGGICLLAFGSSASHVNELAQAHGQEGWRGIATVVSVELLPTSAYMVRRYRERLGLPPSPLPYVCIGVGLTISLAANEAQSYGGADSKLWNAIFAVLPVLVFSLVGWMAETTLMVPLPEPASQTQPLKATAKNKTTRKTSGSPSDTASTTQPNAEDEDPSEAPGTTTDSHPEGQVRRAISQQAWVELYTAQIIGNPKFMIDYGMDGEYWGRSRSWLEKRWREAREAAAAAKMQTAA